MITLGQMRAARTALMEAFMKDGSANQPAMETLRAWLAQAGHQQDGKRHMPEGWADNHRMALIRGRNRRRLLTAVRQRKET